MLYRILIYLISRYRYFTNPSLTKNFDPYTGIIFVVTCENITCCTQKQHRSQKPHAKMSYFAILRNECPLASPCKYYALMWFSEHACRPSTLLNSSLIAETWEAEDLHVTGADRVTQLCPIELELTVPMGPNKHLWDSHSGLTLKSFTLRETASERGPWLAHGENRSVNYEASVNPRNSMREMPSLVLFESCKSSVY